MWFEESYQVEGLLGPVADEWLSDRGDSSRGRHCDGCDDGGKELMGCRRKMESGEK